MQLFNRIYYFKIYWRLNMFRAAHRSSSGALNCICSLWFIYPCGDQPLPRLSGKWEISHSNLATAGHHMGNMVKPEAATAVIELLMMGGKTPETCWAVNKCQDNKLENCCIWLVIYLNCTMMHGLTNLKQVVTFILLRSFYIACLNNKLCKISLAIWTLQAVFDCNFTRISDKDLELQLISDL